MDINTPLWGVRVDGAAGPLALGAKGSVRDRLTPPGRAPGFRPREVYSIVEVLCRMCTVAL